jgi:RHS repeat-associated protein
MSSTNRYRFSGKEKQTIRDLGWLDFSARMYANCEVPLFTTPDPLMEKYYSISPYVYCGNNPLKYIDPNGMYFDVANNKTATKIENKAESKAAKLEKKADKLEAKGKDIGDFRERAAELRSSAQDIRDMRNNENTEFRYAKASDKTNQAGRNKPATAPTGTNSKGDNVVTMFTDGSIGNKIHESRHGGDIARGVYSFDANNNPTAGFGLHSEVSAYRAQYSYNGELNYLDASSQLNQQIVFDTGLTPPASTISNINLITPNFVKTKIGEIRIRPNIAGNKSFTVLEAIYGGLK